MNIASTKFSDSIGVADRKQGRRRVGQAKTSRAISKKKPLGLLLAGATMTAACGPTASTRTDTSELSNHAKGVSLSERISEAKPGAKIHIQPGIYKIPSAINITKPIHLVGEAGMFETIIEAKGLRNAFLIRAPGSGTTIRGVTVRGAKAGVRVSGTEKAPVKGLKIQDNRFVGNETGIVLTHARAQVDHNLWVEQSREAMRLNAFLGRIEFNTTIRTTGIIGTALKGTKVHHNLLVGWAKARPSSYALAIVSPNPVAEVFKNLAFGNFTLPFGQKARVPIGGKWFKNESRVHVLSLQAPRFSPHTREALGYGHLRPTIFNLAKPSGPSLSKVIENANSGDTIVLKAGDYQLSGRTSIDKELHFVGESGMFKTIVGHHFVVLPGGSKTTFDGITFNRFRDKIIREPLITVGGTEKAPVRRLHIRDCRFRGAANSAISLHHAEATIERNLFENIARAIKLDSFTGRVRYNTIVKGSGISGSLLKGAVIHNNLISLTQDPIIVDFRLASGLTLTAPNPAKQIYENLVTGGFPRPFGPNIDLDEAGKWNKNTARSAYTRSRAPRYDHVSKGTLGYGYTKPIVVDPNPPEGQTLKDAIAQAEAGQSVLLKRGKHEIDSAIIVLKEIHLFSQSGMFHTSIDAGGRRHAIEVRAKGSNSTIQDLTFKNASRAAIVARGTKAAPVEGLQIRNCRFMENGVGAQLVYGSRVSIAQNLWVDQHRHALQLDNSQRQGRPKHVYRLRHLWQAVEFARCTPER